VVNAVITAPFSAGAWFIQGVAAAVATIVTLPFGALVGVLLYVDLLARKERLDLDTLKLVIARMLTAVATGTTMPPSRASWRWN
jgi:hypothetical protein